MGELRWALAVLIKYIAVWVLGTFVLYILVHPYLEKRSERTQRIALMIAFVVTVILSLTWLQQPVRVIFKD